MRLTAVLVSSFALFLGATSAPVDDKFEPPVVTFQSWITDCYDKGGHTKGMVLRYRKETDLCFPLPDDIRGLDLMEVTEGCRGKLIWLPFI